MACDREPASLEAAEENAEVNGVDVTIERVDVREGPPPVAPSVVANLTANLLEECAGRLTGASELPATVVCSGMLEEEIPRVADAFADLGLREAKRSTEGDWAALLLRRDGAAG